MNSFELDDLRSIGTPVDGKVYIDDAMKEKMLKHLDEFGVK